MLRAQHRNEEAILEFEMAIAFNRTWPDAYAHLGRCKFYSGSIEETIPLVEHAIRLSPRDPNIGNWYFRIGVVHLVQSRIDQAVAWLEKARSAMPAHPLPHSHLAAAYALKGDTERAAAELAEARKSNADARYSSIAHLKAVGDFGVPSVRALFEGEPRVDHLFLPAGELRPGGGDLLKSDLDGLRSILEVRLLGVTHVVRQARPKMGGGSITLMSGLYSTRPAPGGGMAAAAIAAVEGMTRALALDLAPIRVNAVAPGLIDTPLWDSFGAQREVILAHGAGLPVGRIGRPEEVAAAVIFLMSNEFVTGTVLPIDGGGRLV